MFFTDPSGQDPICGVAMAGADGGAVAGPMGWVGLAGCATWAILGVLDIFDSPSFHGSLKPRPGHIEDFPNGESLGIPTGISLPSPNGIGALTHDVLGMPNMSDVLNPAMDVSQNNGECDNACQLAQALQKTGVQGLQHPCFWASWTVKAAVAGGGVGAAKGALTEGLTNMSWGQKALGGVLGYKMVTGWMGPFYSEVIKPVSNLQDKITNSICNAIGQ